MQNFYIICAQKVPYYIISKIVQAIGLASSKFRRLEKKSGWKNSSKLQKKEEVIIIQIIWSHFQKGISQFSMQTNPPV